MDSDIDFNLDAVLNDLGKYGKFQLINFGLLLFPTLLFSAYDLTYLFTTGRLDYRCQIPECDINNNNNNESTKYLTDWLENAIPFKDSKPMQCSRYAPYEYLNNNNNSSSNSSSNSNSETCSVDLFNKSNIIPCTDGLVYRTSEVTLVNQFNLTCIENEWRLTLIGSVGYMAQIFVLPFHGTLSDRFGRRTMLIISLFTSGTMGIVKSFSDSWLMYVIMEFLIACGTTGAYATLFVMSIEWLMPKYRVLGGTFISMAYSIGQIMLGLISMNVNNFRILLRIMYGGAYLALTYMWYVPESVRWQLSVGKYDKVKKVLNHAAKMNKVQLSMEVFDPLNKESRELQLVASSPLNDENLGIKSIESDYNENLNHKKETIFQSRQLFFRAMNCAFCIFTNSVIYMGLNINAVFLGGNKHLNFILVNLVELPGNIASYFLMERYGRRWPLSLSLMCGAFFCMATKLVPSTDASSHNWHLALYVMSKCSVTISYSIVYIYISELFPTNLRQSYMNICYTFSCIGCMLTPQVSLLMIYFPSLPMLLYGGAGTFAGLLVLVLPETFNIKLPDTIAEAERIGRVIKTPKIVKSGQTS